MNKQESNKLLAEFMEFKIHDDLVTNNNIASNIPMFYLLENSCFDTDWNWLMEIVEKIDEVCGIDLHEWDEHINNALCSKSLSTTYNACVEFVQWYNNQNK
jgi:hypothetical protein